jgi:hypothetical protein
MKGMIIHCGGRKATRDEVADVRTPPSTESHFPVPHLHAYDLTVNALRNVGYEVADVEFALRDGTHPDTKEKIVGAHFFALAKLVNGTEHEDYGLLAAFRNAHDKSMANALALGANVFVCDNMSLSGEVKMGRVHKRNILRDLPHLIRNAMNGIGVLRRNQDRRIEAYKQLPVTDNGARVAIMKAAEGVKLEGEKTGKPVVAWSKAGKVWEQWMKSKHDVFHARNAWSLFNGFTEVLKDYNIQDLPNRSIRLHHLFDRACKLELEKVA